ncbi:MAG: UvrD-helicase domain-containing protein, partial [Clostridia bacterium]|nr:UvrD-helicase domain-containing protein [Clostridia bacterium]
MIETYLQKLNEEQIKPVMETEGPVLVIAGAGSGKTRVLTTRIAYLCQKLNVPAHRILAITFTNKAANEMKQRLFDMGIDVENMWVSTIHSMCVRILRVEGHRLGYDSKFSIYSEQDKDHVIKRILDNAEVSEKDEKLFKRVKFHISNAKTLGMLPTRYAEEHADEDNISEICRYYALYEEELQKSNALDFDDLLVKTEYLLASYEEVRKRYAERFLYVHVDEFQDTNTVQYRIVKHLASVHENLFVVGDDDQSIYGWRGAEIENILGFPKDYPNAKVYKLERNYRSTKKILDLANCVISGNINRNQKQLWTENESGDDIEVYTAQDEGGEARYVAQKIRQAIDYFGFRAGDFAVLMRVNALSRSLEQEFNNYNIPYKVYGGFKFFERKEIKDLTAYLRVLNNPLDNEAIL